MDHDTKIRCTLDALFGVVGLSGVLPVDIQFTLSRKTGRIRMVSHQGVLLCTLKINGSLAITIHFAQMLLSNEKFAKKCCVEVSGEAAPFVIQGRSVFCKHVVSCGEHVKVLSEVPVVFQGQVIAVGKAVLSCDIMMDMDRGVAVKVRDGLKDRIDYK